MARGRGLERGALLLLEMGRISRDLQTRDQALARIAGLLLENFGVRAAAILVYNESAGSVYVSASVTASEQDSFIPSDITLRLAVGSCLHTALGSPDDLTIVDGGTSDPVLGESIFQAIAVIPMVATDAVTGFVLLAGNRESLLRLPGDLLLAVAGQASIVADRAQLLEDLRLSDERYRSLTENAQDLVFILDRGGRFLHVNQACRSILGYSPEEMVGSYFGEFVTPESWAQTTAIMKRAAAELVKNIEYSWDIQHKNGEMRTLLARASLVYEDSILSSHQAIARDLSAEVRLRRRLEEQEQELTKTISRAERMREYLAVANLAQEEERARIAREIHDGSVQYLVALRRRLDLFRKEFEKGPSTTQGEETLSHIDSLLDTAIRDLREFSRNLRPPVLTDFGLVSACEWLLDQTEKEGIRVSFAPSGDIRRLSQEVEVTAFRIVQESLSNALKHANATHVEVSLVFGPLELAITVRDNGQGFVVPESPSSLSRAGQMGLVGMFERAEMLDGTIDLQSAPGKGTTLTVTLPL